AADAVDVVTAPSWGAVEAALEGCGCDIVIVDESIAAPNQLEVWLRAGTRRPSVLIASGHTEAEREVAWLSSGACDVVPAASLGDPVALQQALRRAHARHAASAARAWNEERYRLLVEHTFDVVAVLDAMGTYVYVSPSVEEKFGYMPDDLVGRSAFETVHPDDLDALTAAFFEAVSEPGTTRALEYRAVRKDGGILYMEAVGRAVTGPDGAPVGVINARDVTERKAAEVALRESEARFRALLGALPDVIARLRDDGLVLDFHVPGAFRTETFPQDVLGRRLQDVVAPPLGAHFEDAVARLRGTGEPTTYRYEVELGGSVKHREVRLVSTGPDEVLSILRDVTAEVEAADALHQQEALVRQIVTAVPIIVFAFSPDGQITFAEGRGLAEVGATPEDLVGRSLYDVYGKYDGIVQAAAEAAGGGTSTLVVDVRGRAFDAYLAPVRDVTGRITKVIGVAADVTVLKQHQEALAAQADALGQQALDLERSRADLRALTAHVNEVREEESARISREVHDVLGQALTAIRLGVGWLGRRLEGDEEAARRVDDTREIIDETIRHVRQISADLRPGVLDDFGLVSALEWQAAQFETRTGVPCHFEARGAERDLPSDTATAVFRIAQEALTNVARHAHASAVEVVVETDEGHLRLLVRDDGIGFTSTTDGRHRSLGLLGMQERARMLGGTLNVEGAPGTGTRVELVLPLTREPTLSAPDEPAGSHGVSSSPPLP
ncbi:MAG TPA: PAS domain S-box protein, partial [Rubricoccaceae bacterium]